MRSSLSRNFNVRQNLTAMFNTIFSENRTMLKSNAFLLTILIWIGFHSYSTAQEVLSYDESSSETSEIDPVSEETFEASDSDLRNYSPHSQGAQATMSGRL